MRYICHIGFIVFFLFPAKQFSKYVTNTTVHQYTIRYIR